jgi:hypothetical protein
VIIICLLLDVGFVLVEVSSGRLVRYGGLCFTPLSVCEDTLTLLRKIQTLLSVISGFHRDVDGVCALLGYCTQRRVVIPYRSLPSSMQNVPEACKSNFT